MGASEIAADGVGSSEIAADAVGSSEIAADAVDSAEILNGSVGGVDLAPGAVSGGAGGVVADSTLTEDDLAPSVDPDKTSYRVITLGRAYISKDLVAGTRAVAEESTLIDQGAPFTNKVPAILHLDDADYIVQGRAPKLRLRGTILTNPTPPGGTLTVGLYPVASVAGANNAQSITLGTVVAGSQAAFTAPAATRRSMPSPPSSPSRPTGVTSWE